MYTSVHGLFACLARALVLPRARSIASNNNTENLTLKATRPASRYLMKVEALQLSCSAGDTADVKIHQTDRTNTDARGLLCNVLQLKNY